MTFATRHLDFACEMDWTLNWALQAALLVNTSSLEPLFLRTSETTC